MAAGKRWSRLGLVAALVALVVAIAAFVRVLAPVRPNLPVFADADASVTHVADAALATDDDRTPEIRGRVVDADGNPVPGADVRLVSVRAPYSVFRQATADARGEFSFMRVHAPVARVVADHDPQGGVSSAELRPVDGQTLDLVLVLGPAGSVRGTVVDTEDHPVAGATLSIEGAPWAVRSGTSDDAGSFQLTMVPEEAQTLVAVARGYKAARVPLERDAGASEVVVKVRLVAAAPVDGQVLDDQGNPSRALVVACEGDPSEQRMLTDGQGVFHLPPSTIGCRAYAQHDEFSPSDPSSVDDGHPLTLRLKPGGAIEGRVVDERGAAVPSFRVGVESFTAASGRRFRSAGGPTFNDGTGAFRLDRLAPGRYVLAASAPGTSISRSDPIEVAGGATAGNVRIVLTTGGTVTGRVVDEKGAPLAGVAVHYDAASDAIALDGTAQTDAAGSYRLDGAPAGPFSLRFEKDGYRTRFASGLRAQPHATVARDVTLVATGGGPQHELDGIGASLERREQLFVRGVVAGSPAEKSGMQAGDRLLSIDGEPVDGMSTADAMQRLRGDRGTTVGVSVEHKGGATADLVIVRDAIVF